MKKSVIAFTGLFFVGACQLGEKSMPPPPPCQSHSPITITIAPSNRPPVIAPDNRCAKPGEIIPVNITPASQPINTVMLIAKGTNPDGGGPFNWLTKTNSAQGNLIEIEVPDEAYFAGKCDLTGNNCEFDYAVFVSGKEPVDPRVTVQE